MTGRVPGRAETPRPDAPVDGDEVVRDDEDTDEVLDDVLDQPEADEVVTADADTTVGTGGELAYTGMSLLGMLMAGLVALFSGMGLLRRKG